MRQRRMESDAEDRRRNRRCRRAIFFRGNEEWNRTRKIVVATDAAGGPFFFAATKIRIGRSRPSQQRKLVSDAAGGCRYGRSRRAILHRHDDCAASIRKSGPEIENRCSGWAVLEVFLAAIAKFTP